MSTTALRAIRLETLYEEHRVLITMLSYYTENYPRVCREIDEMEALSS